MPATPWVPSITLISDGEDVSAETVNPVFQQYTQRTQYLKDLFAEANDKSVLVAFSQPVFTVTNPSAQIQTNSVVYYEKNGSNEGVALAQVSFLVRSETTSNNYTPANSSYPFGIVKSVNTDGTADVYTLGLIELGVNIDDATYGIIQTDEIDTGAAFQPGPYYLSRTQAGKITANPGGVPVYVGYALSRTAFLLSPNTAELSQFFVAYSYNILDRPAGTPTLTNTTWTITNPDLTRVGWIGVNDVPAALQVFVPNGAKFFYNLPVATEIQTDGGIVADDQIEQIELSQQLPPNPPNLTYLTVNGIGQIRNSDADPDGIYLVNDAGIWWFDDQDSTQPWASDIPSQDQPADWKDYKGSSVERPRIALQFVKINPDISASLVTSIKKYDTGSEAISLWLADKSAESLAGTGDLLIRLLLQYATGATTYASTAISNLTYNEATGITTAGVTPVVSAITAGSGVTITQNQANNVAIPGSFSISASSSSTSGRVASIEPDGADLDYIGLHSFVSMPAPATLPSSIIGKITLPAGGPVNTMSFVMLLVVPDSGGAGKAVDFNFSYQVSAPGVVMSSNYTTTPITFNIPNPYTTKTIFTAATTGNTSGQVAIANFSIPSSAFGSGNCSVNFKLARTTVSGNPLTTPLGIVDIYWKIG